MRLAGVDLNARWRSLVADGAITAPASRNVSYGVRLREDGGFEEFVLGDPALNATLASEGAQRTVRDGAFEASLQLVRTLRPPPTAGLAELPPYDAARDSFVTGPLRLQLRPRAALLEAAGGRLWDCFHNISPCDARGHWLLLPTLEDKRNWRKQALERQDCEDLASMAHSSQELLLSFNAVRAGASQNHVHCHAWPSRGYAVSSASVLREHGGLALLDYPCATLRFQGESAEVTGAMLASAVEAMGCPYNLALLERTAFLFARAWDGERSSLMPGHRLGASEMCGHFHCASAEQLQMASAPGFTAQVLGSVSADAEEVWDRVVKALRRDGLLA